MTPGPSLAVVQLVVDRATETAAFWAPAWALGNSCELREPSSPYTLAVLFPSSPSWLQYPAQLNIWAAKGVVR